MIKGRRDPTDVAFVIAYAMLLTAFLALVFTAMIRVMPAYIGLPVFLFCMLVAPIVVMAAAFYVILRKR